MQAAELNIDFETASQVDLINEGVYKYATHPSTEILMMGWGFDDEEVDLWIPGDPFPERVRTHVDRGGRINAANAAFERLIWSHVLSKREDVFDAELEQWYCTLYKARCNNLPASLDKLARCLGTFNQKHATRGRELIKFFCILDDQGWSRADWSVNMCSSGDEEVMERLAQKDWDEFCDYCEQDVRAERDAGKLMREPTEEEWQDYWVNERINDRGIKIDRSVAQAATQYAREEEAELVGIISEVTQGEVEKARGEKLKAWVMERLTEDQLRVMVRYRKNVKKYSLDKASREELLEDPDLDPDVAEVITCSDMAQKSSVSKFSAMLRRAQGDDRVRGALMANGASASGRYSSKGLQVHNFTRDAIKAPYTPLMLREDLIDGIVAADIVDYFGYPIMHLLSRMLRPAIIPEVGRKLVVSDWSAIEGRFAPWLTCTNAGEKKLDLFRNGVDTYIDAAEEIFNASGIDEEDPRRQVGKVAELSLQFGGGANAFRAMGRNYGIVMDTDEANDIKNKWRAANPWAKDMWDRVEKGAFAAVRSPRTMFPVGKVTYFAVPDLFGFDMTLFCQLPCGRLLTYPDVRVTQKKAPWGDMVPALSALRAGWTPKADAKEWPRGYIYGGLMFENIVQGSAASLLRSTLRRLDELRAPTILSVHDEPVLEVNEEHAESWARTLDEIMVEGFDWTEGLPLKAGTKVMDRYGK